MRKSVFIGEHLRAKSKRANAFDCKTPMDTNQATSPSTNAPAYRLLDINEVRDRLKVGTTFIYTATGFPKPIKQGRRSFWVQSEIDAYVASRMAARG